jgi:asparagine synthase (glutamine-hydrolysing)
VREVPKEILMRRWKGGAEHLAWRILRQNLPFVRELLLDGELIRSGLLNRPRLESLLNGDPASVVRATVPVFGLVGAEAWLQAWSLRMPRSP